MLRPIFHGNPLRKEKVVNLAWYFVSNFSSKDIKTHVVYVQKDTTEVLIQEHTNKRHFISTPPVTVSAHRQEQTGQVHNPNIKNM